MPNPWHDEIGRFAPKGTGSTGGVPVVTDIPGESALDSKPGSLRRQVEDVIDILVRGRPRMRDSDIELLKESIGNLMPEEDLYPTSRVPVVTEIPGESKLRGVEKYPGGTSRPLLKSSEVDDFYNEAHRVLQESLVGLHDMPEGSLKDRAKRKIRQLVDKFMEDLDEDLGDKNWDPIGLVPYAEERRWEQWR